MELRDVVEQRRDGDDCGQGSRRCEGILRGQARPRAQRKGKPGGDHLQERQRDVVVYRSAIAGTNQATSATWALGEEFDGIVRSLKQAGIAFEHYDMPDGRRDGDVHVFGDFKAAWFKDPDGNILHVNNG
jgi:hypothetical protein